MCPIEFTWFCRLALLTLVLSPCFYSLAPASCQPPPVKTVADDRYKNLKAAAAALGPKSDVAAVECLLASAHDAGLHELEFDVLSRTHLERLTLTRQLVSIECMKSIHKEDLSYKIEQLACRRALTEQCDTWVKVKLADLAINTLATKWSDVPSSTDEMLLLIYALNPNLARGYFYRAIRTKVRGNVTQALAQMKEAILLGPQDPDHWLLAASWLCQLKRKREALELIRGALCHAVILPRSVLGCAYNLIGFSDVEVKQVTDPAGLPTDRAAHCLLVRACSLGLKKEWRQSQTAAREALALSPHNGLALLTLIVALDKQGKSYGDLLNKFAAGASIQDLASLKTYLMTLDNVFSTALLLTLEIKDATDQDLRALLLANCVPPGDEITANFLARLHRAVRTEATMVALRKKLLEWERKGSPAVVQSQLEPLLLCCANNAYRWNKQHPSATALANERFFEERLKHETDCSQSSGHSSSQLHKLLEGFLLCKKSTSLSPFGFERLATLQACDDQLDSAITCLNDGLKLYGGEPALLKLRAAMELRQGNDALVRRDMHALEGRLACTLNELRSMRRTWESGMAWDKLLLMWKKVNSGRVTRHIEEERRYYLLKAQHSTERMVKYQSLLAATELSIAHSQCNLAAKYLDMAQDIEPNYCNTHELRGMIFEALGRKEEARSERAQAISLPRARLAVE